MKKNLRIVSAAAAALLAVAPIAAAAAPVNADAVQSANQLGTVPALNNGSNVNVTPKIVLTTSHGDSVKAALSVSFSATFNGTTATSNFTPDVSEVKVYHETKTSENPVNNLQEIGNQTAGSTYKIHMTKVGLNFGTKNANKELTLSVPAGDSFTWDGKSGRSLKVRLDRNGAITLDTITLSATAKDFANPAVVNWRDRQTGANVTSGSIELYSGSDAGRLNVAQVVSAAKAKYYAENSVRPQSSTISYSDNLKDALKALNITVDSNGWFTAPKSFSFNLTASANNNDAKRVLPITVTVPDGKDMTPAQETGVSKTIMHVAQYYDKNGAKTTLNGKSEVHAYDSVSVVATPVELKDASGKSLGRYYKIANQNAYIKVGNIDGTSRTLSHNAYLYKRTSSGRFVARTHRVHKKTRHVVVKKGTQETTYGSALYGKKYYRIGRNQYIKVANFR